MEQHIPAVQLVWFLSAWGAESFFPATDDEEFYPAAQIRDINVLCPQKHCATEQYCTCPGPVFLFYAGWISVGTHVRSIITKSAWYRCAQSLGSSLFVAYLKKCLHPKRAFDHFDGHSRRVVHPRALCDCSKGAMPQEGFHQIKVGFWNKKLSWIYFVFLSRIVRHCGIHRLRLSLATLDGDMDSFCSFNLRPLTNMKDIS